ncbi:hypothetical protein [uncultured Flavobacterium sp.]|uniref:hypothetical protein n=1 Tax=uncultured Flavobacterium sp. TaxID=165435 RepID=UPI00292CADD6|nr:hypothetical protein [uncultured Flavobacterium sp.]
MEKSDVQRLKKALDYLESKQRELKRQLQNDTRSIDSLIKYLKREMLEQFYLSDYNPEINSEIKNTETFINSVKNIIEKNS